MAVRFVDYWKGQTGQYPARVLFDSRVTTYSGLNELNQRHVGFIMNKPTQVTLGKLFPTHEPSKKVADPVFLGGPVNPEVIFALVQGKQSPGGRSIRILDDLYLAIDRDVVDSVIEGVIPKDKADEYVIVCGVFIHPQAKDDTKIRNYNYEATKQAIANAMKGFPSPAEVVAGKDTAKHPFAGN